MFHDHLNPNIANEHARGCMAEMESSIARQATERGASGALRCRLGKHSWRCRGQATFSQTCVSCAGRRVITRPGGAGAQQKHPAARAGPVGLWLRIPACLGAEAYPTAR